MTMLMVFGFSVNGEEQTTPPEAARNKVLAAFNDQVLLLQTNHPLPNKEFDCPKDGFPDTSVAVLEDRPDLLRLLVSSEVNGFWWFPKTMPQDGMQQFQNTPVKSIWPIMPSVPCMFQKATARLCLNIRINIFALDFICL